VAESIKGEVLTYMCVTVYVFCASNRREEQHNFCSQPFSALKYPTKCVSVQMHLMNAICVRLNSCQIVHHTHSNMPQFVVHVQQYLSRKS
jgi:hypothetical protein